MKKEYHFKKQYKILSFFYFMACVFVAGVFIWIGNDIWPLIVVFCAGAFFQYRWRTKPYVEIDTETVSFRLTWTHKKAVELKDITKVQVLKKTKLLFFVKGSESLTIDIDPLVKEDKKRVVSDLFAIINGEVITDLSNHLIDN